MSEIDDKIKIGLNIRKKVLRAHIARFKLLKKEGRWFEAWNQLLVTLKYFDEILNELKNINQKMPQLSGEQRQKIVNPTKQNPPKRMIIFAKRQNVH
jgi:hypothetical protein